MADIDKILEAIAMSGAPFRSGRGEWCLLDSVTDENFLANGQSS